MLYHLVFGNETGPTVAVLHGILGSCQNWRFFTQRLFRMRPDLRFVLIDLRNHGKSPHCSENNNLHGCVSDIAVLQKEVGTFDAIVGHSFGGKVALQCATGMLGENLQEIWALDSNPGRLQQSSKDISEVAQVISMLKKIPLPLAKRQDLVSLLVDAGASVAIAKWMTTNLKREPQGYVWKFHLDAVTEMIQDYFDQDLWNMLENPVHRCHIVRATQSNRWTKQNIARLEQLSNRYHQIDAGHWIHADNPDALLQLLGDKLLVSQNS